MDLKRFTEIHCVTVKEQLAIANYLALLRGCSAREFLEDWVLEILEGMNVIKKQEKRRWVWP